MNAWISDLGNRLELNYNDGKSENIWIEQDEDKPFNLSYKIFITDSNEAASLIAQWLSNKPAEKRIPLEFAMKIYLDGMEAVIVYAQDAKAAT